MIRLAGLTKRFDGPPVLNGVTLDIHKGQSLAVIGGSGSGKSVMLKCILGLLTPDEGEIYWNDAPLTPNNRADFLAEFGMLFQSAALFDGLKIWENVAFRMLQSHKPAAARDHAIEKLTLVGLGPDVADRYPAELSGGMQKRAGLARAIATDPKVVFFDEPTTGLDPIRAAAINRLIRQIVDDLEITAVTITHDISSVRAISDHVAFLHEGAIAWHGAAADLDGADHPLALREFISAYEA